MSYSPLKRGSHTAKWNLYKSASFQEVRLFSVVMQRLVVGSWFIQLEVAFDLRVNLVI